MNISEQTFQQIDRAIRKIAENYPAPKEASLMTDIHIRVTQETGEMVAYNDDDAEINRCVIEQWINNSDDNFYDQIASVIRKCLMKHKDTIEQISILKPFSFVLENDDKESVEELYLVDDETVIIDPDLMEGLSDDLDTFLEKLLKDYLFQRALTHHELS